MFKNKEIKVYFTVVFLCLLTGFFFFCYTPEYMLIIYLLSIIILLVSNYCFIRYRYYKINQLSTYLQNLRENRFQLSINDYEEGELSILKSEIYKLTILLTEQSELLLKDKAYLADSLSDISHQLKTPLTSMMVMADLLEQKNLPEEKRKEFVLKIQIQLQRMEWLVSTLLKMSKLDAKTVELKKEAVLIKDLIHNASAHLLIPMDMKEQFFCIEGDDTISLLCDPSWTAEAFSNLLKNSMEHTPVKGSITINFEETALYIKILIHNTGRPIAPEDLPYIFKRFYRGKNAAPDSIGIGLAFAKQIISLQNGTISVTSTASEGTTFTIKFYKKNI